MSTESVTLAIIAGMLLIILIITGTLLWYNPIHHYLKRTLKKNKPS